MAQKIMKKLFLTMSFFTFPFCSELSCKVLQPGSKAPDFSLLDDTGTARSLAEFGENGSFCTSIQKITPLSAPERQRVYVTHTIFSRRIIS